MINPISIVLLRKNKGFTLIELVMTIIIIGILAVAVLPKFFDASGFEEYAYRAESISALRAIQQRAMQNTNTSSCHQVLITAKVLGEPDDGVCSASAPSFGSNWALNADDNTSVIISQASVSYQVAVGGQYFEFDSLGRPACLCTVDIVIQGAESLTIRIEVEGYIHAL